MDPRRDWLEALTRRDALRRAMAGGMVLSSGGLLAACGGTKGASNSAAGSPATGAKNSVRLAMTGAVRAIDPDGPDQNYVPSQEVIWACYDTLVSFEVPPSLKAARAATAAGLEPKPLLAESWESAKGDTVYRFQLRQGVVSNFGNPLTPESVLFMVRKTIAAKANGAFFFSITGITDPKQVKAVGDDAVEFTIPAPNTLFLLSMGTMFFFPYDEIEMAKHTSKADPYGGKWLEKNTAGFGPYKVKEIGQGGNLVRLTAHTKYWGEKPIAELTQQSVPDQSSRLQLLLSGDTDHAENLSMQQLDAVEKRGLGVESYTSTTGAFLGLTKEPPWDDPAIRQAFAKAIPYEDIVKTVYHGRAQASKSHFVPWMQGWVPDFGFDYDPEAAKAGLAPVAGEKITFSYSDQSATAEQVLVLVQTALQKAGVTIEIQKVPGATYQEQLNTTHEIQNFCDTLHTPIFTTPWFVLFVYFGKGGFLNWSSYENPKLEAILKKLGDPSTPVAEQATLARDGQQIMMGDLPIIPVVWSGEHRAVAKGLKIPKSHTGNGLVYWGGPPLVVTPSREPSDVTPAAVLRGRLSSGEMLFVPGVYNALVARVMERAGFEAVYVGGYAAAAANFALPDIGLMTQTEMCNHIARIRKAVSVPIIADADTGFGDVTNVARTVREYEFAGAAAVQIEDQTFPKRCGHMEGKSVIEQDEMVRKVRAAVAARTNPDTVIVARTDAIAVTGVDDAIDRLRAYADAGADLVFPDAPRSVDELKYILERIEHPVVANFSEHGKTPLLSGKEVAELGVAVALYPTTALFAAVRSAVEMAEALRRDGTSRDVLDQLMAFDDVNELLGLGAWQREEADAL